MIHQFPRFFFLLTVVLFIGTVATLQQLHSTVTGVSDKLWILLGLELGCFLCICLCAFRETYLLHGKILRQNAMLKQQALHDYLTGCYNRRALFELLAEMELSGNVDSPLGCLMIDIDHFKSINDTFGHAQGDLILIKIVDIMQANLSSSEYLARYGGEEFCVLLPGSSLNQTIKTGQKLSKAVAQQRFIIENRQNPIQITVSIGATCSEASSTVSADKLIISADAALYRAKNAGRNRVSE